MHALQKINSTEDIYNYANSHFTVLNGNPGYINYLDAYGCWNLVYDLGLSLKKVVATSFKHTSPAGVSTNSNELTENEMKTYNIDSDKLSIYGNQSSAFLTYLEQVLDLNQVLVIL